MSNTPCEKRISVLPSWLLERDGDERFGIARAVFQFPRESEDEALGRRDLAIDAAVPQVAPAAMRPHAAAPRAAHAQVRLHVRHRVAARAEPLQRLLRLDERREHDLARRIEQSRDAEDAIGRPGGEGGLSAEGSPLFNLTV